MITFPQPFYDLPVASKCPLLGFHLFHFLCIYHQFNFIFLASCLNLFSRPLDTPDILVSSSWQWKLSNPGLSTSGAQQTQRSAFILLSTVPSFGPMYWISVICVLLLLSFLSWWLLEHILQELPEIKCIGDKCIRPCKSENDFILLATWIKI